VHKREYFQLTQQRDQSHVRKLSMSSIPIILRHWIQRYYLVYQLSLKFVAGQLPQNILFYLQKVLESVWNGHQTC
jgi:hypothetical protein